MSDSTIEINPSKGLYIKLGRSGGWEKECLDKDILRFGYNQIPFDAAIAGDWETVGKVWRSIRKDPGAATRDIAQIRHFFEAGNDTLWVTFSVGFLWWCTAKPGVKNHPDGEGSYRETVDGWHNTDIYGKPLSSENLSVLV